MAALHDKRIRISKLCSNLSSWTPTLQGPILLEHLASHHHPWLKSALRAITSEVFCPSKQESQTGSQGPGFRAQLCYGLPPHGTCSKSDPRFLPLSKGKLSLRPAPL